MDAAQIQQEQELITLAQADSKNFSPLYEMYVDRIFQFVFRRVSHRETAEDLCAQTFLKALEKISSYKPQGYAFSAWLYTIATHTIADHFKSATHRKSLTVDENFDVSSGIDEEELSAFRLDIAQMQLALAKLPAREQEIISLRFMGGFELKEIADQLGISANNASVILFRGLKRLRADVGDKISLAMFITLLILCYLTAKSVLN